VKPHDELSIPAEPLVIRTTKNELHRVSVTTDEILVLVAHSLDSLADEDPPNFVHRDRDLLHSDRGSDRLSLEVSPELA
jgi:hypothetical protein